MPIYTNHPKYLEFIKNERKTLQFLSRMPYVGSNIRELANSCEYSLQSFPKKDEHLKNFTFKFHCNLDILIEKEMRRAIIEVEVSSSFKKANYSLSICGQAESPFTLIRKFHFDYAIPLKSDRDRKPVYHMQYGGEDSPGLTSLDITVDHLQPWLSSPRLYYIPINLAIFLDIILIEFKGPITNGLSERDEWRELIKNNEVQIIAPYITNLSKFVQREHNSKYLLRDYYYGS